MYGMGHVKFVKDKLFSIWKSLTLETNVLCYLCSSIWLEYRMHLVFQLARFNNVGLQTLL